jgi:hypothetical protein
MEKTIQELKIFTLLDLVVKIVKTHPSMPFLEPSESRLLKGKGLCFTHHCIPSI